MPKAQLKHSLKVAQRLLKRLDCPRALTVSIMLKSGSWADILALKAVPEDYNDHVAFKAAYQATRLLQKASWLPAGIDKRSRALETFWAAESKCADTNSFFKAVMSGDALISDPRVSSLLMVAKRKIRYILKGVSPFAFLDHCGFGPGSDSNTANGFTATYNKLCTPGAVTRGCSVYLDFIASNSSLGTVMSWDIRTRSIQCDRTAGNKVTFVPKDAKTHRTIAVEPRWNVYFQKGMGKVLRQCLREAGTDLDDQSRNQSLAKIGSVDGSLATIDLKSASDTVSRELVRYLLPQKWVSVLDHLRSPYFSLDGEWHESEKWSSMGNGYTFELESLIFHALLSSVTENFSVYGDDLIVPSNVSTEVVKLLSICGFSTNEDKTFTTGPFRESCGADYFLGNLVTPIYWKEPLNDKGTLRLVNQISRLASSDRRDSSRDRRFYAIWNDLVHRLPEHFRYRVPSTIASGVHDTVGAWAKHSKWGWDGWFIKCGLPKPLKFRYKFYEPAVLACLMSPSSDGYVIRDRYRWRVGTVFVPCGTDTYGPWN